MQLKKLVEMFVDTGEKPARVIDLCDAVSRHFGIELTIREAELVFSVLNKRLSATHEYSFNLRLLAVARVIAATEEEARSILDNNLGTISLNYRDVDLSITEASLSTGSEEQGEPQLFEIDGKEAKTKCC